MGQLFTFIISCILCLFSFIFAWTFISLQIKEFRIMGLSINDSVYSCVFFSLTGLHFFHLVVGLLLLGLSSRSCSFLQEVLCQLLIFGNRKRRIENICILGIWPGEGFYVKYYYILFLVFYIVLCLYIFIYRIKRIVILLSGIDLFYYLVFIIIIFYINIIMIYFLN